MLAAATAANWLFTKVLGGGDRQPAAQIAQVLGT